jgi:DNA-binding winged helix-turn-helix (wHTH) protein
MKGQTKNFYEFGPFRFDPAECTLRREGKPLHLSPKVAETLSLLVQNAGHLVDKDKLMKGVWPDAFVEEGNLNKNIFLLRKTLGQWDDGREYIETVPKRGYRFACPVNEVSEDEPIPGRCRQRAATGERDRNRERPECRRVGQIETISLASVCHCHHCDCRDHDRCSVGQFPTQNTQDPQNYSDHARQPY